MDRQVDAARAIRERLDRLEREVRRVRRVLIERAGDSLGADSGEQ